MKSSKMKHSKAVIKEWIIDSCRASGITNRNQIKYVLATVAHETNHTFMPVREAYWLSEDWRKRNLRYYPYYGRGYVQITWETNYRKFSKLLNRHFKTKHIDLVKNPDLALDEEISLFILIVGMKYGMFTGYKLDDFITKKKVDFRRARKIVNGLDKAKKIAKLTNKFSIDFYVVETETEEKNV